VSYFARGDQTAEQAEVAISALSPRSTGSLLRDIQPYHRVDMTALRHVLIAATCPLPCKGYRVADYDSDWHEGCEKRADDAIAVLRGNLPWLDQA
jgi:hypothetical protein